jgi:hypothetical protein
MIHVMTLVEDEQIEYGVVMLTGENRSGWRKSLSQCHFIHHIPHMDWSGTESG